MQLTFDSDTITLRSFEWGDTATVQVPHIARTAGNTVKTLHRETPVTKFYTGTSRGNCLDDIIDFLKLSIGDTIIIDEDDYVIHEQVAVTQDHTGYTVTLTLEKICSS